MSENPTEGLLGVDLSQTGTQMQTAADAPVQDDPIAEAIRIKEARGRKAKDYANPGVLMSALPESVVPPTVGRDSVAAPADEAPAEETVEAGAEVTLEITEEPEVVSGDAYQTFVQDQPAI